MEPRDLSIRDALRLMRNGELKAEALVSSCLERIRSREQSVHAWVEVADERSALTRLAAAGVRVSPGAPFMVSPSGSSHVRVTTGQLDEHDTDLLQHVISSLAAAARAEPTLRGV